MTRNPDRADEIRNQYIHIDLSENNLRFGPLFNSELSSSNFYYNECSEGFTSTDVENLLGLACEGELDRYDQENQFHFATVHAMNALLLLVSNDRSLADIIAQRMARRCTEIQCPSHFDIHTYHFISWVLTPNLVILLCECGPIAIPYLVTEMQKLLLSPVHSADSLASHIISEAMRDIIRECYKDIPLAISLTDQCCAPLLEIGQHPTEMRDNPYNKRNASYFLGNLVDIAILISDEKKVLELCRSGKCEGLGYKHSWIDVLRLFSLEPHPQDELLRTRGNRMDWVIQTWNENHSDKQYPFLRGAVHGPFPGQPGYELPKRLFRHKYCTGSDDCRSGLNFTLQKNLQVCERCRHTYYCCDECQREAWYNDQGGVNGLDLDSCPPKFRIRPLKRLTKPRPGRKSYHRPQCLLVQAYKQWVKIDKKERKAEAKDGDDENVFDDELRNMMETFVLPEIEEKLAAYPEGNVFDIVRAGVQVGEMPVDDDKRDKAISAFLYAAKEAALALEAKVDHGSKKEMVNKMVAAVVLEGEEQTAVRDVVEAAMVQIEEEQATAAASATSSHDEKADMMNKKGAVGAEPKEPLSKIPDNESTDGNSASLKSTEPVAQSGPKYIITAPYGIFCSEMRPQLEAENPWMKLGELGKLLVAKWGAMDDAAKAPYKKKAEEARLVKNAMVPAPLLAYDVVLNKIFAEKFQQRQEKHLKKKMINRRRSPCVSFMAPNWIKGVDEERMRQYFDERYVLDDSKLAPATLTKIKSRGYLGMDTATRSTLKCSDGEIPLVMVRIMRDPYGFVFSGRGNFEYQNSDLLRDPSNFEVYSEIEKMHYEHSGGKVGYSFIAKNFSGKDEDARYTVRISVSMFDNP